MKLIALKRISGRLPKGAIFEEGGSRAKMLIAIKAARVADLDPSQVSPVGTVPEPVPVVPVTQAPRTTRTSTRSGQPVGASTYQRRDLTAEDSK